ncbi:hypothetical protein BGX29_003500 [Mortierella sp. GBA35]|nr:hypothetical protein BGX29_003500 [Mortierella sp. GBA35]
MYSILANVEPSQGWDRRQIIYVFSCLGGGLLLGAICWLLNRFTVWILGALAGGRIGLLVGASVLGLMLALVISRRILIPATAIVGAYISVVGLDLFARTGFSESIKNFFTNKNRVNYTLTTNLYIMLGVVGGLIVLGVLFQTLSWRHRQRSLIAQGRSLHKHDSDWSPCGSGPGPLGYPSGTATTHVNEKKRWNPFKKGDKTKTTTITTTTATNNINNTLDHDPRRVSYSSNAALNQNSKQTVHGRVKRGRTF